jgi:hypothetical protein
MQKQLSLGDAVTSKPPGTKFLREPKPSQSCINEARLSRKAANETLQNSSSILNGQLEYLVLSSERSEELTESNLRLV